MKTSVVSDSELLELEVAISKQYKAYVMLLRRAMLALQDSDDPSNNAFDHLSRPPKMRTRRMH